ncbi:2-C-methyl-D-erythritol 4-phosphate cytidylyltransferase [Planctellipticum variicoloris]|uniref:2-C-methyl-D-erythritol 4-phosphate cytidylyltransferase n=1 Tax=Planctellipticum variicoloris TaxID=3064265 RepID=UPI002C695380|nr:2-C-methyl-D-erythritol 4-phosphate cytidylyltransferase [Planctomycetaceae bacterium SH412]HTN02115.1 2-C-methyl-D-erythritol 4-phosphate cytidylyltransferase [Planctomycetaceae bacterium]
MLREVNVVGLAGLRDRRYHGGIEGDRIMATFAVILPAAGKSSRFGLHQQQNKKKVFVDLKGRPVWVRTAEHFVNRADVVQTIIAVSAEDLEWFKEKFRPNLAFMNVEIIAGGAERADSVERALARVRADVDFVAVHDAARPLLAKEWIDEVFDAAVQTGGAILAAPVTATLKRVDSRQSIEETVPRAGLWEAQTPQVFRRRILLDAFAKRGSMQPTDEAQLVEAIGGSVKVVSCSRMNLKITTQEDLRMAEALLDALPREKTLRALHPFADEDPLFR